MSDGQQPSRTALRLDALPEDIVREIFKHCRGLNWSYRDLARLCRVCKAWQATAQEALYRDLRVDHRQEVERLATALQSAPRNAAFVQSVVINGDGAHAAHIYRLLKLARSAKHIFFFDFEFDSSLEQEALCCALPGHNLTSLAFAVLPADFVVRALKACCEHIVSLRIYRVDLGSLSANEWSDPETTSSKGNHTHWQFTSLRNLSLWYIGDVSEMILQDLVIRHSKQLRSLKLRFQQPGVICKSIDAWEGCDFSNLAHLDLGSFYSDVASHILQISLVNAVHLKMLRLPGLRSPVILRTVQPQEQEHPETPASSPPTLEDLKQYAQGNVLDYVPRSVEHLDFSDCKDTAVCLWLPTRMEEVSTWLPQLKSCPKITIGANVVARTEVPILKTSFIEASRKAGLAMYKENEYYAVEGYWDAQ